MPILTLFAGPNGSGKSTIVDRIRQNDPYPYAADTVYLNADDLEKQLRDNPFFSLRAIRLDTLTQPDWEQFMRTASLTEKICQVKQIDTAWLLSCIRVIRGSIIIRTVPTVQAPEYLDIDSYIAALIIDFIRYALIDIRQSFAFETVMSHSSKLEIMRQAADAGFTVHLYYVTTRDADINVARVRYRVARGGHPVDEDKIRSRYYGSLENLAEALRCSDEAWLFDNSTNGQPGTEIARKKDQNLWLTTDDVPGWYFRYVEQKFIH